MQRTPLLQDPFRGRGVDFESGIPDAWIEMAMRVEESGREGEQKGPADVVRVLVENRRKFLGFVQRQVESKEAAEDILQEALARGIRRIESVRDDDLVIAWF